MNLDITPTDALNILTLTLFQSAESDVPWTLTRYGHAGAVLDALFLDTPGPVRQAAAYENGQWISGSIEGLAPAAWKRGLEAAGIMPKEESPRRLLAMYDCAVANNEVAWVAHGLTPGVSAFLLLSACAQIYNVAMDFYSASGRESRLAMYLQQHPGGSLALDVGINLTDGHPQADDIMYSASVLLANGIPEIKSSFRSREDGALKEQSVWPKDAASVSSAEKEVGEIGREVTLVLEQL